MVDIPKGIKLVLPATWPGLSILIDSLDCQPKSQSKRVSVRVYLKDVAFSEKFNYDGVAAVLQVNKNVNASLLCVTEVSDVGAGDLFLLSRVKP